MKADQVRKIVGDTPHTPPQKGEELYDFVLKHGLKNCLELGFAHGVGTVWIAAALQEMGTGKVVCVDNQDALTRQPSAREMVEKAGLADYVELHYDEYSYNWHLRNHLEEYRENPFDLVFLDGAHNWDVDGFAFFLCSQILRKDGWFLFDDLDWSYASSPTLKDTPHVQAMSQLRQKTPQVRAIWEQLVLPHPDYGNFVEDNNWGWAQKIGADASGTRTLEVRADNRSLLRQAASKVKRTLGAS